MAAERSATLGGVGLVTDAQESLHPLSVEDYHRMLEVGILTEDDRVELLEGAIIEMSSEGPPHAAVVARLNRFVTRGLQDESLIVRVQGPVTIRPSSEPQPDLAVVDVTSSTFRQHPHGAYLAIEVAHTSLRKDLSRKARIYAGAGVREYWVVDLAAMCVHVHLEPRDDAYAVTRTVAPPAELRATCVELPPLALAELLAED